MQLVQNATGFNDARIDDIVECLESVAANRDKLGMAKERQMLRKVSLGNTQRLNQFFDLHFLLAQKVQDFQPLGIRQDFIGFGIALVGGARQRLLYLLCFHSF